MFNGGWTHSSTGALPNGTTGWADTKLAASILAYPFLAYYSRSNTNTNTDQIDMGSKDASNTRYTWVSAWYKGSGFNNILGRNSSSTVLLNGGITTDSRGFYWINKIATTAKLGKNSTILNTATDTQTPSTTAIGIGANATESGISNSFSNREVSTSIISDNMTDTDVNNCYTAIQTFNTTLGRQVV